MYDSYRCYAIPFDVMVSTPQKDGKLTVSWSGLVTRSAYSSNLVHHKIIFECGHRRLQVIPADATCKAFIYNYAIPENSINVMERRQENLAKIVSPKTDYPKFTDFYWKFAFQSVTLQRIEHLFWSCPIMAVDKISTAATPRTKGLKDILAGHWHGFQEKQTLSIHSFYITS